ncbi:MAG: type II toxin-antitoxin system VapC family toxin [Acidobacteriota bacterium]
MSLLLDTNVISEIRKVETTANPGLRDWFLALAPETPTFLSVLTIYEIRHGIERAKLKASQNPLQLEEWLRQLQETFSDRILPITTAIASRAAGFHATTRRTLPLVDALLASTAVEHDLLFVTRNTKDIEDTGVDYLDPFSD